LDGLHWVILVNSSTTLICTGLNEENDEPFLAPYDRKKKAHDTLAIDLICGGGGGGGSYANAAGVADPDNRYRFR
jgi:hypothetical protein